MAAILRIEPAEQALALGRKPDRAIGSGSEVVQTDAGANGVVFCPERAFLRKTRAGREEGDARGKKLAAIHGVTPTVSD
jgi:hypothetical protein